MTRETRHQIRLTLLHPLQTVDRAASWRHSFFETKTYKVQCIVTFVVNTAYAGMRSKIRARPRNVKASSRWSKRKLDERLVHENCSVPKTCRAVVAALSRWVIQTSRQKPRDSIYCIHVNIYFNVAKFKL